MEQTEFNSIIFTDTLSDYDSMKYADSVLHILCRQGSMSFALHNTRYNIAAGDYVILPNLMLVSGFSESGDFRATIMYLSNTFVSSMAIRSNYGIIGHLSLLQNPVMQLSSHDFRLCDEDLQRIRERMEDCDHLFREEMLGSLLTAHILNLYDIHARGQKWEQVSERTAVLIQQFIGLLYQGEYIRNRDITYYASQLCITPHYLSEICKKVSGKPATYWIDRFLVQEITRLLRQKDLPLNEIAERLSFSSLSYFSRYVQKSLGVSPSMFRMRFK